MIEQYLFNFELSYLVLSQRYASNNSYDDREDNYDAEKKEDIEIPAGKQKPT